MTDLIDSTSTNLEYIEGLPTNRLPGEFVPEFTEEDPGTGLVPEHVDSHVAKDHRVGVTMASFVYINTNADAGLNAALPFGRANTARVDNYTTQWCLVGGVYIEPLTYGWVIALNRAETNAKLGWSAPPGITQPASTAGALVFTTWYEERFPPQTGKNVEGSSGSATVVVGNQTPGDAVANPTDAVDTRDFQQVWSQTDSDWDRMVSASGDALASTLGIAAAGNVIWNGATWDRQLEVVATADPASATGIPLVAGAIISGGNAVRRAASGSFISDAGSANNVAASAPVVFNGANWDRIRGSNTGATGAVATTAAAPTAANMLDGFANVQATTTTTLVTVPSGRTWIGYVGTSCATAVAAGGAASTVSSVINTANGTGTTTPTAGTYARSDVTVAAVGAALSSASQTAQFAGQRLIVQAAGGTALIQHVGTIVAGTGPQASGWAIGELM